MNQDTEQSSFVALFEEIMGGNSPELKRKIKTSHYVQNWIS